MSKRTGAVGMVVFAVLFVVVNRAAYKGYFQDDELDVLSWAPRSNFVSYVEGALTPRFFTNNFRPVGHFYFYAMARLFDLDFPKYVAVLQFLHLFNVWLLWMVARQLRAPPAAAFLACIFFGFHMALFDAFWKPMYVFDVLCGTFCLLALLFWAQRRWVLSFVAFWLAYKAKELAVMLPVVLACYEFCLGKRSWKPLIPFFAASLSFGLQGLILNPNKDNDYTFRFTLAALRKTSAYYASRVFLVPYLGFLVPLAALPGRNRRAWFGLAMAATLFFPILFLPGRIFSPYCYVPFTGLALALSGVAEAVGPVPVAIFLLLFAPWDLHELRVRRNIALAHDNEVRGWVGAVADFARKSPHPNAVIRSGHISDFASWGMQGAIHYLLHDADLSIAEAGSPEAATLKARPSVAYVVWNDALHRTTVTLSAAAIPDASYIDCNGDTPVWQLEQGWFDTEGSLRWTAPLATARLTRPAGARQFELRMLVPDGQVQAVGPLTVRVWLNGSELETRRFSSPGWQTVQWDLAPGPAEAVEMKLRTDPPFHPSMDNRTLGIAAGSFGFTAGAVPR